MKMAQPMEVTKQVKVGSADWLYFERMEGHEGERVHERDEEGNMHTKHVVDVKAKNKLLYETVKFQYRVLNFSL